MVITLVGRLMTCSIAVIFIAAILTAIKALLKRHLSLALQYRIWFPFLFILAVPFIPFRINLHSAVYKWVRSLKPFSENVLSTDTVGSSRLNGLSSDWLQDFSISVSQQVSSQFYQIIFFIWLLGVIFMSAVTISSCMKINRLKHASLPLQNRKIRKLYNSCIQELHVKQHIPILSTAYLKTPVAVGIIKPCIIIPINIIKELPENELRFILIHELLHFKHRDTVINLLVCLARILYWFHPIVWISMRLLQRDGESACDGAVLSKLTKAEHIPYGDTLLKFAASLSGISYTPIASISGRKNDLKKRILGIRDYHYETRWDKIKGTTVFILVTAFIFSAIPSISSNADTNTSYDFLANKVEEVDLSSYFHGFEGSFVLYDTKANQYSIYNRDAALKRISPNSTYKIYSALTALQAGVIKPESTILTWDNTISPIEIWNQDQTLSSAMMNSVTWYFQSLDKQSGLDTINQSLSALSYGNQDLSGGLGRFWIESSLKISAVEQVELLARFNAGTLPFDAENVKAVKDSLFLSKSNNVSLYGKTGTGRVEQKDINGWIIGFVESPTNTYVFAVNIQGDDGANSSMAGQIALDILKDKSIYYE